MERGKIGVKRERGREEGGGEGRRKVGKGGRKINFHFDTSQTKLAVCL